MNLNGLLVELLILAVLILLFAVPIGIWMLTARFDERAIREALAPRGFKVESISFA